MERRTILAVVLMAALFIAYEAFLALVAPPPPPRPPQEQTARASKAEPPAVAPAEQPKAGPGQPALTVPRTPEGPRPPQRLVTVETPLYRAVVSSEGGKLQEFTLKYRGEKPLVLTGELGPGGLLVGPGAGSGGEPVAMDVSAESIGLREGQRPAALVLAGVAEGLRITETLEFSADTYVIDARIRVDNVSGAARSVTVSLPWTTRQAWHETKEKFIGQHPTEILVATNGHIERMQDLCAIRDVATEGAWIATGSTWYLAALIPRTPAFRLTAGGDPKACESKGKDPVGRATIAALAAPTIAAGSSWEGRVQFYAGPKEYDRLKVLELEGAIDFGGFPVPRRLGGLPMEWLGVPILLLMNWVYRHVGNYGVAIVLLTVISKILFFPLTIKSMRSMKAMQALQPHINALRSKYKADPQRLQRETLELYRKHKVNPVGGCLPMVAQVPIFYALYLALSVSVELQNASFLCFGRFFGVDLWICDLASQDPTYVLPILMGVTMFVQQKMTPVAGDPRQAKMMLFMPVVFTFMFLNLPSGLVLYWTVSNLLQIAQQYYLDRPRPARAPRTAKDASRA